MPMFLYNKDTKDSSFLSFPMMGKSIQSIMTMVAIFM